METPGLKVPRSIGIEDRELFPRAPESTELLKDTVAPGTGLRGNQTRGLKGRGSDLLDLFWIPGPGGRWPWSIPLVPTPHRLSWPPQLLSLRPDEVVWSLDSGQECAYVQVSTAPHERPASLLVWPRAHRLP